MQESVENVLLSTINHVVFSETSLIYIQQEITVVNDSMSLGHIIERKFCKYFCHCKTYFLTSNFVQGGTFQEASLFPVVRLQCISDYDLPGG